MRCIPWETCILIIDEIEDIICKRNNEGSNNSSSIVNKLLTVWGGIQNVKNLFIIGITNYIEKIDEAILRRFEIKIFIGNPTYDDRKIWLRKKINNIIDRIDNLNNQQKLTLENYHNNRIDFIAASTTNYSNNNLRLLFERIYLDIKDK